MQITLLIIAQIAVANFTHLAMAKAFYDYRINGSLLETRNF